ncbi:MAG: CAP domain-containing protein [Peptoniphilus harei]|nr:CAP domain-containing protein [Peptoniphilus harei]
MKKLNLLNTKNNLMKFITALLITVGLATPSLVAADKVTSPAFPEDLTKINNNEENLQEEINLDYLNLKTDDTILPVKTLSHALGYNLNWKNNKNLEVNLTYAKNPKNNEKEKKSNDIKGENLEVKVDVDSVGDSKLYMKKLNNYRTTKSLKSVKEDEKLNKLALLRAKEELDQFINTGKGDHNSPGSYNKSLGENLTLSYYSLGIEKGDVNENSLTRWINSPGHNANLLNKDCNKGGYACARKVVDGMVYESSIYLFGY